MNFKLHPHLIATATWLALATSPHGLVAQTLPTPPASPTPVIKYEYDAVGNPTKTVVAPSVPGLSLTTSTTYDSLYRPKTSTDPKAGVVTLDYNGADRLTRVTDPRSLVTQYPRNGLGDATQLISPDTGTASHTFDAAGNLKTRTDSRSVLSTYTYDVLNRPTRVAHSKTGSTSETHNWAYDQTGTGYANGVNRLTSTTHPTGSTQYQYDPQGRLTVDTQRINAATGANSAVITRTISYTYNAAGNVTSITYPSGRRLTMAYNSGGQPTTVSLAANATGAATALISNIQWEPFGAPRSWNWQMNTGTQAQSWSYDTNGRLTRYRLGDRVRDLTYDAADRITAYTHYNAATAAAVPSLNQSFSYDELGRISISTVGTSSTAITYDANGNRITTSLNATASSYTTPATSNRLTATTNPARTITYDTAGNPTAITGATATAYTATYNLAGRLATLTKAGATTTYAYDNDGRRIRKFISSGTGAGAASTVIFAYDQNDQLIGEYSSNGTAIREYVWLGNMPIAIFTPDPAAAANPPVIFYIHTDHLNTPRVVVNKANQIRWRWLAEPFGTTAPETNPSSLGNFTQPLRFPGQYADQESGLFYNHWRYFDPSTGRFTQADPLGLAAGDMGLYNYVGSNPLMYIDPNGLWAIGDPLPQAVVDFGAGLGDVLTFGITGAIRDQFDIGGVNKCSNAYTAGEVAGIAASIATGFTAGTRAVARASSPNNWSNFSHSGTPASWQRGSWWSRTGNRANGDYIPTTGKRPDLHDLMDATAARIGGKYPTWPLWRRTINRMPYTPGSAMYGGASAAMNDCECAK
jgi:RHS repeat-associated protein